ncbi:MAG: hypothetical protein H6983_11340 [Ectothiorhodospiraceae bacterium]|nr:hypothetical protein [Chromatiales bacterium]MCP5154754.1 hypothetical protein [Ectothiorhodospiraceae bacterium]
MARPPRRRSPLQSISVLAASLGLLGTLAVPPVSAEEPGEWLDRQAREWSARGRRAAAPAVDAVTPKAVPLPAGIGPNASCEVLYRETSRLLAGTQPTRPGFHEDPAVAIASAAVSVFPPAIIVVGAAAITRAVEAEDRKSLHTRIAELRRWSAEKDCFVR